MTLLLSVTLSVTLSVMRLGQGKSASAPGTVERTFHANDVM